MRLVVVLLGAALLLAASCDEEEQGYDYLAASFIDTVLAGDTIQNSALVPIVHVYPGGCNHFERLESSARGKVLELAVIYHWHYEGLPCAHGSGLDTTSFRLTFASAGECTLAYDRSEAARVAQPVFVK